MNKHAMTGLVAAFAALLTWQVEPAQASDQNGPHWGDWQAMGGGYVARRRVPPPPEEELQRASAAASASTSTSRDTDLVKGSAAAESENGGWLTTGPPGLYAISTRDLARAIGRSEGFTRVLLSRGKFHLSNGGEAGAERAEQSESWIYDASRGQMYFVGEPYDTFYSTENAYRASRLFGEDNIDALPMPEVLGTTRNPGTDRSFRDTLVFEEEPEFNYFTWAVPNQPDADFWFWDFMLGGIKDSLDIPLSLPNPASRGELQISVHLQGFTDVVLGDDHYVSAELNGQPIGSISWDGFNPAVLEASVSQSLLNELDNNLVLRVAYPDGRNPGQLLDKIVVSYERLPVAESNQLWLHGAKKGRQRVTNFTSNDLLVIESPGTEDAQLRSDVRVESEGAGTYSVSFRALKDVDYLIAARDSAMSPGSRPNIDAELDDLSRFIGYLIITPREFSGTAEALAEYHQSQFSRVEIVYLDAIYSAYSAGREDPTALARFMANDGNTRRLSHLVMLGKGTVDGQDRMGYGDDYLPLQWSSTPFGIAPSDTRLLGYADDAPFAVGRIPITSDAEGLAYVAKLRAHDRRLGNPAQYMATIAADDPDNGGPFHSNADSTEERLLDDLGFDGVNVYKHPIDDVRSELTESANWEVGLVVYDGHGSTAQAGNVFEEFLLASDVAGLGNAHFPIFSALTCAVGDDSQPGVRSLAATLVLSPDEGAIAAVAPTGLSFDEDAQVLGAALLDNLYGDGESVGEAMQDARRDIQGLVPDFMTRIYSVFGDPMVDAR